MCRWIGLQLTEDPNTLDWTALLAKRSNSKKGRCYRSYCNRSFQFTVPILLAIVTFPLLNFKSPTFFTKFNVLGTISVLYVLLFNGARLIKCGVHISLSDVTSEVYAARKLIFNPSAVFHPNWVTAKVVSAFSLNFPALTGTLTLSYFIHNCILTILRHQENPKNNVSDGARISTLWLIEVVRLIFSDTRSLHRIRSGRIQLHFRGHHILHLISIPEKLHTRRTHLFYKNEAN